MSLHTASGRWRLGLVLALATAACWATLPVALKLALAGLDPYTLTWFRFVFATVGLGLWLAWRGRFGEFRGLSPRLWLLLALAALMLIGNYVFYLLGLYYTTPGNAQLLIQLAPLLMGLGGILVFGERYVAGQWLGFGAVVAGLLLFFRDQLATFAGGAGYLLGAGLIVIAAVVWAVYALTQKQLLVRLSSPLVLWFIYAVASLLLLPLATPTALLPLSAGQWTALLYCAVNTLIAYGAFAEALAHWEASRVSAVLALTPLLTFASVLGAHWLWPSLIDAEQISALGLAGALLVVFGSALTSLLGQRRRATAPDLRASK